MSKSLFFLILLTLLSPVLVRGLEGPGEDGLTLSGVIAEVKEKNPSLSSARWRLGLLEADVAVNSAYPNPSLEMEKSASGDTDGYEVKASQPVPLTRRAGTARSAALAEFEAGKLELEALETVILAEARKAWYALRISKERRRFEETNLKFSMDLLNKIEMRMQTGEAGNSDLARSKVEVTRSRLHLQEAETMVSRAAGELNSLMGRRPDATVAVSENGGFSLAPVPPTLEPLEHYTAQALTARAEPRALAFSEKAADLTVKLEKGKRLPVPEVGFIRGVDGGEGYSKLSLGLELPLWYNNKGEIKMALARKASLGYEGKRLELDIRREVHGAWLEMGLAQKRLAAARETVFMLNDLRRTAAQEYLSGKIGLTSFYETNRVFLEENISYLDALKEFYERTAQLDAVVNKGDEK